jgi:hypothetical protein
MESELAEMKEVDRAHEQELATIRAQLTDDPAVDFEFDPWEELRRDVEEEVSCGCGCV